MDDGGFVIATDYTEAFALLDQAIEKLEQMNQQPEYRRRSLSVAITELETGRLWANKSLVDYLKEVHEE
jgi:hypothetical protein